MATRKVNKTDRRNVAKPVSQLRGAAKTARIAKVTKAEAGPATIRGGMAPGAGRSKPVGTGGGGVSKPVGGTPRTSRAITNGSSPAMRQLRAKAVQANRQAQGKPVQGGTKGRALSLPNSARAGKNLIKEGAKRLRVPGDSGQVRAAQARGQAEVARAQARRGARAAMKNMEGTLKAARTARNVAGAAAGISRGGAAAAGLQAYNTGDATLKAALKRGDYKPKQGPTASTSQGSFNKKTFDQAFKAARSSGAKEFTWRGKRYNTKKRGE